MHLALLLLFGAIALATMAALGWRQSQRLRVRQAALNILQTAAKHHPRATEYQAFTPDRIAPALQQKVETPVRELERSGFRLVCIYENVTLGKNNGKFVPQWYFVSTEGPPVGANVFHLPPLEHPTSGFETILSDGRLLRTTNAGSTAQFPRRPEVEAQVLASGTPIAEVLANHRQLVSARLGGRKDLVAHAPGTPDELFEENQRQDQLNHDFRRKIGWVTEEQLVALAKGKDAFARSVFHEIRELLKSGYDPLVPASMAANGTQSPK